MVLTLLLGAAAIVSWVKTKPQKQALITSLAGFCVVFLPGMAWLGYYNHRLTGSALRLPYAEHHAQYGSAPLFIFQPLRPMEDWPSYNNPQLLQFAKDSNYDHLRKESWSRMLERACYDLDGMQMTFFGNIAGLAGVLLILPLALLSDRKLQWTSAILLVFAAVLLLETYMFGHYVAPAGALMLALTLRCARWMWKSGRAGRETHPPCGPRHRRRRLPFLVDRLPWLDRQTRQLARNQRTVVRLERLDQRRFPGQKRGQTPGHRPLCPRSLRPQ